MIFKDDIFPKIKDWIMKKKIFVLLIILIFCAFFFVLANFYKDNTSNDTTTAESNYATILENKITNNLKKIENIGDVNVMVSLESGFEYVYAVEEETKNTASGSSTTSSLILVSGEPILIKEIYPKIKGVVVIASGAENISVRLAILEAIQTILDVENNQITILN